MGSWCTRIRSRSGSASSQAGTTRSEWVSLAMMNGVISADFGRTSITSWAATRYDGMFTLMPFTVK